MSPLNAVFTGAQVLWPGQELEIGDLAISDGWISGAGPARAIDLSGFIVLPGIIDVHGDGFERHLAPRRGAMSQMGEGVVAAAAELAANGITTGVMAQFHSWEGGLRSPDYADQVFAAIAQVRGAIVTDLIAQLRFETHMLDDYAALPDRLAQAGVSYVVFNDHLPHKRLAEGRKPPRMTGQALKAGRNPEVHFEMMKALHARADEVPAALDQLTQRLATQGVRMGSHDDTSAEARAAWRARGVVLSEFPETETAAMAARAGGDKVIMGAPNVVRGGSHNGNVDAIDLIRAGLCDALASDYHYPSPRRAALKLVQDGICGWDAAWALVSSGPAEVLGLSDRGTLGLGLRADLVILEGTTHRVAATLAGGQVSYMSGAVAHRFFG
ncbi:MAG: alpha-D-ribose 1-methylphosphonate 5-triphosphate diphosphatase [Sedimentitalea sp.]